MLRIQRLAVIAVAWVTPVSWIAVALFAGPSDGTRIASPTAAFSTAERGDSVTVLDTYGDTPLHEGDVVETVDGRSMADWVAGDGDHWESDDVVTYRIRRQGEDLDRIMQVEVTLTAYPLAAALADNLAPVAVALGLLICGSVVFWVRPRDPATCALLGVAASALAGLTAYPLGLGVIDLAGARGAWPHIGGEVLYSLGLGFLLVAALTFPVTRDRPWCPESH